MVVLFDSEPSESHRSTIKQNRKVSGVESLFLDEAPDKITLETEEVQVAINKGMKYYYLYQIRNIDNGKIYVGAHSTSDLNDGYMGSGKILHQAFKKYGIEKFEKTILEFFKTEEAMYNMERSIVTEDFVNDRTTYNLNVGGYGSWYAARKTAQLEEVNRKRSQTLKGTGRGEANSQYGNIWITNGVSNKKISRLYAIPEGWRKGRVVPSGWGENISSKLKGRSHTELYGDEKAKCLSNQKSIRMKGNTLRVSKITNE